MSAANKKAITKCWLQKCPLTGILFILVMKQLYTLEKMTCAIRLQRTQEENVGEMVLLFGSWSRLGEIVQLDHTILLLTFTAKVTIVLDFVNNHPMTSCYFLFGVYVRVCMFTVFKKKVRYLLQLTNLAKLPLWNLGSSPSPILSKVLRFRNSILLSLYLLQLSISKLFWISSQKLAASTIIFLFTFRIWIYFTFFQTWGKTDVEVFISATVCY